MDMRLCRSRALAVAAGIALIAFSSLASADPPSRVARLAYISGAVSFSPAGEDAWIQASLNRPLTTSDRIWADAGARAEVQVGGAVVRMNASTDVSILNLDDQIAQLQLTQGTLNVRVLRLEANQSFEVDTPNLAFTLRRSGAYRIQVDPDGSATSIFVRSGQGEVDGESAAYVIDSHQPYRFTGTDLQDYQDVGAPAPDDFDRWASERDRTYDDSASLSYVSQDVVGYQDLDAYGTWRADATYGNVWVPARVSTDWSPYHDGHWAWIDPWGWTWIDDAPWGFAVSHYGRWANISGSWCWVPGPPHTRAYYAPALVAFVGGGDFTLSVASGAVGGVAWFPLGPREVYRPSYAVSRGYFDNINRSNTVVNATVINNYYNNTNVTNITYVNRRVPGAVVAVPKTAFEQSLPVAKQSVRVEEDKLATRPVAVAPSIAPTERSVRGPAAQGGKPPAQVAQRMVIAREAPPAERAKFAPEQKEPAANPGKPSTDEARKELKPAATSPAAKPEVKVIAKRDEAPPTARPPAVSPGARPQQEGPGKGDQKSPQPTPPRQADEERQRADQAAKAEADRRAAAPVPEQRSNAKAPQNEAPRSPAEAPRPPTEAARKPDAQPRPSAEAPRPPAQAPRAPAEAARKPDEQPRPPAEAARPPVARPPAPPTQAARPALQEERGRPEQREPQPREQAAPRPVAPPPQAQPNPPPREAPRPPAPPQQQSREPAPAAKQSEPPRPGAEPRPRQERPAPTVARAPESKPPPTPPAERKKNEPREDDKRDQKQ